MPQAQFGVSISAGGVSIQQTIVRSANNVNSFEISLPAAKPLSAWLKTDANTAGGNLPGGHGLTNGTFDVYWDGGARYGVPGTITTNALALDGGTGDDFPASADATVRVSKQVPINTAIDGDSIVLLGLSLEVADPNATSKGRLLFEDAAGDDIATIVLAANSPLSYDIAGGVTNPFTGDPITTCQASNGNSSYAATLKIICAQNA